ncbi:MAG: META domain-containing protein [Burkholderiaceae bacterium]|jgi:heat shock protein HslJ|nr:META domain-containing protein [Burkholderiaceae bacterium]MEB2320400.1 META domain-containing protein [Pseudomonadota bacterium]
MMPRIQPPAGAPRPVILRRSVLVLGIAALAGCAQTGGPGEESAPRGGGGILGRLFSSGLSGSQWSFAEVLGKPVPKDARPEANLLNFEQEQDGRGAFSAGVGCNRMGGRYRVRDEEVQFRIDQSTKMACDGEAGIAERRMVAALSSTDSYRISRDRLELLAQGQVMATLNRR